MCETRSVFFVFLLLLFMLYGNGKSIYAQDKRSQIIATTHLDTASTTIVSYDYLNHTWDTLLTVNDYQAGWVWFSAYDPYNRRYFYYGLNNPYLPTVTTTYYSLNLYTAQRDSLFTLDGIVVSDAFFDIYRNSLLVRRNEALLEYNFTSGSLDTLLSIPFASGVSASYVHYYDYIRQTYTYRRFSPNSDWVGLDLKNPSVQFVIPDSMVNNMSMPTNTAVDVSTGTGYGISKNLVTNTVFVVSVAANPNFSTIVSPLPPDFFGHLNQQRACFDDQRGLYLLPYHYDSLKNKLAIVDLVNNSVQAVPFSIHTNHHHLDNMPVPVIKLEDSILLTNWFPNYTWYLNGIPIPLSDTQMWQPTSTGWYKVSTVRPDNSTAYSESLYIAFTDINRMDREAASLTFSPNPASSSFTIHLNLEDFTVGPVEVRLYSIAGSLVHRFYFDGDSGPMVIPVDQMNCGIYVVVLNYNGAILREKILITR